MKTISEIRKKVALEGSAKNLSKNEAKMWVDHNKWLYSMSGLLIFHPVIVKMNFK
jgi:hypothetical protein